MKIAETFNPAVKQAPPGWYRWELLMLLWGAFFLNQADRQIFNVVLPLIREDLSLTDAELGLIASALVCTYGLLVPVAGFFGDFFSKKSIVGFSLLFWSVATLSTGLCTGLIQFVLLRGVATGGGEAFYAPSANALLSEHHEKNRSLALSIHQTAVYSGIILSGLIAGYIGENYGWQAAFYIFGGLGILLAFVFFLRVKKDIPPKPVTEASSATIRKEVLSTARIIIKKPTVVLLTLAFACMVFVNVGYLTWMPMFMVQKFGMSITGAGFSSLFYHHIGAFAGVLSGARLSDYFTLKTGPKSRLVLQMLGLLLGAPFIYLMGWAEDLTVLYIAMFLFGIFRGWYDSNIVASLYEVVSPGIRSSSYGLMLACAFVAGAFSPLILGILKPTIGLSLGLSLLSVVHVLGGSFIAVAVVWFFRKDSQTQDN